MTSPHLQALLERKLASLGAYVEELETTLPPAAAAYAADPTVRRAVERLVQIVVECGADAGDLLLAKEGRAVGDTAREIYEGLRAAGIISDDLGRRFVREHSGLRNRIVHDYDELDNTAVWQGARQLVPDARELLTSILVRLQTGSSTTP
jgi:uncharacterized protein YutE (UPF0331/DUF86 family)